MAQILRSPEGSELALLKKQRDETSTLLGRTLLAANTIPDDSDFLYAFIPDTVEYYLLHITATYSSVGVALIRTHYNLIDAHTIALSKFQAQKIPRQEARALKAKNENGRKVARFFINTLHSTISSLDQKIVALQNTKVSIDEFIEDWKRLNDICVLLIQDIAQWQARSDGLNDTTRTIQNLRLAIYGIGVSSGLALLSLFSGLILAQAPKQSASIHHPGMPSLHSRF